MKELTIHLSFPIWVRTCFGIMINGSGTGDMLDHLSEQLFDEKENQNMKYPELQL